MSLRGRWQIGNTAPGRMRVTGCLSAWLLGVLLGIGAVLAGNPAQAHTSLVSSSPADQSTLAAEPTRVSLDFDEPLGRPAFVVVTAPDGTTVSREDPEVAGTRVSSAIEATGLAGQYTVAFRVVSTDGHTLSDELTYTVSSGHAASASAVSDSSDKSTGFFSEPHGFHLVLAGGGGALTALFVLYRPLRRRRE